jgi:hypothetical protein
MSPCFISSIIILDKSALTYFKYRHNIVLLAMNRNNTTTPAIVAIFMIATLVVGATLAATMTPSAFAGGGKKVKQDKYMRGPAGQDGSKKGTRDNQTRDSGNGGGSGNENGNTVTVLAAKNKGFASGFDTSLDQEAQNVICTHPGNNASCTQEGAAAPTPSNCNGVEDEVSPTDETDENSGVGADPDTPQPPGVVCPPDEDEPANQEQGEIDHS